MPNAPITFFCPACTWKLTVAGHLAGVSGPCPKCRQMIKAPLPPNHGQRPAEGTAPSLAGTPPPPREPLAPGTSRRPEPRNLPARAIANEPVAKPMPENHFSTEKSGRIQRSGGHRRKTLYKILIPLFFLIASGVVVFGVLRLLGDQSKSSPKNNSRETSSERKIAEAPNFKVEEISTPAAPGPSLQMPVPTPEQPSVIGIPPKLQDGVAPLDPTAASMNVLESFLKAKTLAERLPIMETQTPEEELAKSVLASSLPQASDILTDSQETNGVEGVMDIYYSMEFDAGEGRTNPQTILVRTRGPGPPKVVADPFLDSFGGRLAEFAKTPNDRAGVFQVIVDAVASCNDERVPNREKKLTLKLLPRDNAKEIARAYFGRQSNIGLMLEDGTYSLSYGKAKAVSVMLRWNKEDRPETPYLEALDLKTLDWNP